MSVKTCQRCGRDLTPEQCGNKRKYCSRDCFYDSRFGEKVKWNGVWIRPGQSLDVLKLYEKGLSESEARKTVGADFKAMRRIRNSAELARFIPKRSCLFCGKAIDEKSSQFKYCSNSCKRKAKYDRKRAAEGRKTHRTDQAKRNRAIDLYSRGLDSGSIARCLNVTAQRVKYWVYTRNIKRSQVLAPELIALLPLERRLGRAESAGEWKGILHGASNGFGSPGHVTLVTETLHGSGAPGRYAAVVTERLKQTLDEGSSYAFCNILRNAITVLEWKNGDWSLSRTLKSTGTFVWPDARLGDYVTVTQAAFSHLLSYKKQEKTASL